MNMLQAKKRLLDARFSDDQADAILEAGEAQGATKADLLETKADLRGEIAALREYMLTEFAKIQAWQAHQGKLSWWLLGISAVILVRLFWPGKGTL
jgi:hypothetical protein